MADKKASPKDPVVEVGFILIVLLFLWIIWSVILNYYLGGRFGSYAEIWASIVSWFVRYIYPIMILLAGLVSILAIVGSLRSYFKLTELNKAEQKIYGSGPEPESLPEKVVVKNERWERVLKLANSHNSADWRLAIIEADVILEELLRAQGYQGDSLGEMLKGVEKSDMVTLDQAWEAHKVRNRIAHDGGNFELTDREARHVISLFELVFREFKII